MNTTTHQDLRAIRRSLHAVGPEFRNRMRAALEDAGVTRQQWRILTGLQDGPATAEGLDEAAARRRKEHGRKEHGRDAHRRHGAPIDATDPAVDTAAEHDEPGHPLAGGPGRFGRRGFGPGFGPFGRGRGFGPGFGPAFGPGFGPHADHRARRRPTAEVLDGLAERGWVQRDGDAFALTQAGASALEGVAAKVGALKAELRDGVSDEDWATAMSVLHRLADNARR